MGFQPTAFASSAAPLGSSLWNSLVLAGEIMATVFLPVLVVFNSGADDLGLLLASPSAVLGGASAPLSSVLLSQPVRTNRPSSPASRARPNDAPALERREKSVISCVSSFFEFRRKRPRP